MKTVRFLARNLLAGLKRSVQILRYANLVYQSRLTAKTQQKNCAQPHTLKFVNLINFTDFAALNY